MIGERVERALDLGLVGEITGAAGSQPVEKGAPKAVGGEQAVEITAHHPAVRRNGAVFVRAEAKHRAGEAGTGGSADVHLVATDRRPRARVDSAGRGQRLVAGEF